MCDEAEIFGCTYETACNYNESATEDDNTCEFISCLTGCTDTCACNYMPQSLLDDGSCTYEECEQEGFILKLIDSYTDGWDAGSGNEHSLSINGIEYFYGSEYYIELNLDECNVITFNDNGHWSYESGWTISQSFGNCQQEEPFIQGFYAENTYIFSQYGQSDIVYSAYDSYGSTAESFSISLGGFCQNLGCMDELATLILLLLKMMVLVNILLQVTIVKETLLVNLT